MVRGDGEGEERRKGGRGENADNGNKGGTKGEKERRGCEAR